jgi:uncharacterized membrane protein YqjE
MNRHAFRWDGLAFGLFFLAALGQWAVWEQDLLTSHELAYLGAAVLIVLGVLGIAGTAISVRSPRRTAPFTPTSTTTTTSTDDEPTDNTDTPEGNPA